MVMIRLGSFGDRGFLGTLQEGMSKGTSWGNYYQRVWIICQCTFLHPYEWLEIGIVGPEACGLG
jgi:hypothetical protein